MGEYIKLSRIHTAGIVSYSLCTLTVLIEVTILLIIFGSTSNGPNDENLIFQEKWQYIMAWLQLLIEAVGVVFRKKLSGNRTGKSVWIAVALCLSVALFGFAVGNLNDFRQLIIFVVSCMQISAMIVLVVTLL